MKRLYVGRVVSIADVVTNPRLNVSWVVHQSSEMPKPTAGEGGEGMGLKEEGGGGIGGAWGGGEEEVVWAG